MRAVRVQNPPGRFLQKDEKSGLWYDIGDQKAREKTSQALREGAPEIRREITTNLAERQAQKAAAAATHAPVIPPPPQQQQQPSYQNNALSAHQQAAAAKAPAPQHPGVSNNPGSNLLAAASYFPQSTGLNPFDSLDHIRMVAARQASLEAHTDPTLPPQAHHHVMGPPDMEAINAQARKNAIDKLQRARAAVSGVGAQGVSLANLEGLPPSARVSSLFERNLQTITSSHQFDSNSYLVLTAEFRQTIGWHRVFHSPEPQDPRVAPPLRLALK